MIRGSRRDRYLGMTAAIPQVPVPTAGGRWDRYLGMTAPMTQVPVPTAIIICRRNVPKRI